MRNHAYKPQNIGGNPIAFVEGTPMFDIACASLLTTTSAHRVG